MGHAHDRRGTAVHVVDTPFTLADYLAMDDDGVRYEVVEGQPVMVPALAGPHQLAVGRLLRLLDDSCPAGYVAVPSPIDWVLWEMPRLQTRQPDVVVVSDEQAAGPRLTVPPLLVVEILSPDSFERDVIVKRRGAASPPRTTSWRHRATRDRLRRPPAGATARLSSG